MFKTRKGVSLELHSWCTTLSTVRDFENWWLNFSWTKILDQEQIFTFIKTPNLLSCVYLNVVTINKSLIVIYQYYL